MTRHGADRATSLWRDGEFLKLWGGQTVSVLGSQVTLLVMPLVALRLLHASTFQVGVLTAVERLPFLLLGLPAGAIVDRVRRRPVLIICDLGRAVAIGSVALTWWTGSLTMAQLYVVVLVAGSLTVFFDVADQSYLPSLVGRTGLVEGNAKLQLSESAATVVGPGLGGILYGVARAGAVIVDAASYLLSALAVFAIRRPEPAVDVPAERPRMRHEVIEGLRYVWRHPLLRPIALTTAWANLFGSMTLAVIVTFGVRQLGLSSGQVGLVFSLSSVGFLVGAAASQRVTRRLGVGPTILWAAVVGGLPGLVLPLAHGPHAFWYLVVGMAGIALIGPIYNVAQVSLRQAICPDRLRARMNATMRFVVWGTMPIGAFLGGLLGSTGLGLRGTLWVAAVGAALWFLPLLGTPVHGVRTIPEVEVDPDAGIEPDLGSWPEGGAS